MSHCVPHEGRALRLDVTFNLEFLPGRKIEIRQDPLPPGKVVIALSGVFFVFLFWFPRQVNQARSRTSAQSHIQTEEVVTR